MLLIYSCPKYYIYSDQWSVLLDYKSRGSTFGTSVDPAFHSWFAVEYLFCFISAMNLDLHDRYVDSLMRISCGPNNFYVYINHIRA